MKDELAVINEIRQKFHLPSHLGYGIGDDSAILNLSEKILITVDSMIENIHFDLSYTSFYHLGFKIVSVNVSDIYAMGGDFIGFLLAAALPETTSDEDWNSLLKGINDALKLYGGYLIGGDISKSKYLCLTGVAVGQTDKPILRKGAEPGDFIFITAPLGVSACGLEVLKRFSADTEKIEKFKEAVMKHLMPVARNSKEFKSIAKAMIDISDGLLIDLYRVCKENNLGAEIYLDKLPISDTVNKVAKSLNLDPLKLILSGGEDYELLVISDKKEDAINKGLLFIGKIVEDKAMYLVDPKRGRITTEPQGWKHF
ncbi:MAG: thiamine-phosphate kinase [Thermodesulfovibrio sp.]|nr:thiamine-phosphate kinase [Thermodesulfovibrio sp.]